ncbi:helix-turn-helix domain-containing protein [Pedobacter glucosidilyticus]|uniref:helix-turn-helix domain-containing protein n=1 Tax=Pedobacter glucosidilyticus TaxID=1122941 RepID=UPI0026EED4A5|nr:helix-turn-helix domain-containing protein [Pedobacter glucosidilyticus]
MNWTILKTESDYNKALERLDIIFDAEPSSPDFAEAELLGLLISNYEDKHYPIASPNPIEAIKLKMEELGLKNKDLQPYIGSKSYVSSILSGKREITLRIANILHHKLGIPTVVFFNANV